MATQEFYLRSATETEARGPFTLEQLVSLAESGKVTQDLLYYDGGSEQWVRISDNAELKATLFPEKKKLRVKPKEGMKTLNTSEDAAQPITVDHMLAAAEGRTAETRDRSDPMESKSRAASIGLWASVLLLLISAGSLLLSYPSIDYLIALNFPALLTQPFALLGALDLFLALLLTLQVVTIYPVVRFRAAFGAGFVCFVLWSQGQSTPALALGLGYAGLYLCTVFVSLLPLALSVVAGFAGLITFAYFTLA